MKTIVFLRRTGLRAALLAIFLLPAISAAIEYPAGTAPDPLWLRACPVNFFGSNSHNCELLGLIGPVARVSYSSGNKLYRIFEFDNKGRIAEVQRDNAGGWSRHKFSYRSDGLLTSIVFNGQPHNDFQYSDGVLLNALIHINNGICAYSFSGKDKERLLLEANCKDNLNAYEYRAELDSRGRMLKLDKIGSRQINVSGPLECTWSTEGKLSASQCADSYSTHRFEYNERGRPISYNRKFNAGNSKLVLSFSYVDDSFGNWTSQTIRYVEMGMARQLPSDVVRTRAIEYFN
ncbi:MAG: hypothetical protein HZA59_10380 [Hydrogenophilales bacterium]|nr:hypothetical protein [Hydrogenophilales bacterium]